MKNKIFCLLACLVATAGWVAAADVALKKTLLAATVPPPYYTIMFYGSLAYTTLIVIGAFLAAIISVKVARDLFQKNVPETS